jgi:hypothetical protein
VSRDADRGPCLQLGVDVPTDGLGLSTERVADKVDALLLGVTAGMPVGSVGAVGSSMRLALMWG